jgi:hypothetical protein
MNRTSIASSSTAYRSAASWPGLLGLRRTVVRWLFAPRPPRRVPERPLPAPVLQFGMHVDGRAVRGTRWGHGPLVYLTPDATGRPTSSTALVRSLLSAGYGVVALEGRAEGGAPDRVLAAVTERHGAATAVVAPADPDAGATIAGLLAGRRVRF